MRNVVSNHIMWGKLQQPEHPYSTGNTLTKELQSPGAAAVPCPGQGEILSQKHVVRLTIIIRMKNTARVREYFAEHVSENSDVSWLLISAEHQLTTIITYSG